MSCWRWVFRYGKVHRVTTSVCVGVVTQPFTDPSTFKLFRINKTTMFVRPTSVTASTPKVTEPRTSLLFFTPLGWRVFINRNPIHKKGERGIWFLLYTLQKFNRSNVGDFCRGWTMDGPDTYTYARTHAYWCVRMRCEVGHFLVRVWFRFPPKGGTYTATREARVFLFVLPQTSSEGPGVSVSWTLGWYTVPMLSLKRWSSTHLSVNLNLLTPIYWVTSSVCDYHLGPKLGSHISPPRVSHQGSGGRRRSGP